MRVLLDECLPRKLKRSIVGHNIATVQERGWSSKKNGELFRLMDDTVDVFLTSDQNLRYQQNLTAIVSVSLCWSYLIIACQPSSH
jgi:hypothetical protein